MSQRNTTVLLLCLSVLFLAVSAEGESRVLSSIPEVMIPSVESNICLKKSTDPAGFDYDALSISERTQRFIDGPCSPLILVPGVEGSRLQVNIDCETLKSESPDVFKDCGWNSCDSSSWEPWKLVPDSQYDIWVPDPLTPMDILANVVFPKCWGGLFTLSYDASEPEFSQRLKNPPGVTVQWYKQGSDEQECGLDAISTLLPAEWLSELNGEFSYFQNMITSLKSLGYITGVSLFATPYDWRRSPESDETHYSITGTADLIHSLTGKKAVLLSHSLGNMQVLYTLNHMTQEAKDSTIAHYVAVMPPYIGAAKAADNLVGTNDFDPFYAGINTPSLKQVSGTSTSLYDIIPKATYQTQANEPYMQDLMTRLNAEKKFDPSTPEGISWWNENASSLPYQWFPTPNEDCSNGNMEEREEVHCIMGIRNWAEQIFLQIEDRAFAAVQEDLDEFVTSGVAVFMPEERTELYDGVMKNEIGEIINPNVEVTTIYGASLNTINNVYYDYDPAKTVREGKNTTPTSIGYELGDGTVPVSSALLGSLKWGWEYEHGTNADAKPIHLLEWCSSYEKGTLSFNQQESSYSGLWCKCLASSQDGSKCDHMKSVTDPNLINWVGHFLTNLDNPVDNSASPSGLTMSDSELTTLATTCPTLNNLPNNPDKRPSSNVEVGNASDYFLH